MVSENTKSKQAELINLLSPNVSGIYSFAEYIGKKALPVAPIGEENFENFFEINRPDDMDGIYAYITFDEKLTVKMGANYFKSLFTKFDLVKKLTGNTYGGQLDFLIIVGLNRVLIFDAEDYSRRLDLTKEKLERKTGKYNDKFDSLKFENIEGKYVEDDFGEYTLHEFFSTLFRFSISDDKAFEIRTKKLRGELLTYITNHLEAQKIIINEVVHESIDMLNYEKSFHKEIISAVTDTLVLRQILVRILEGRYGFSEKEARDVVKTLGLGSSLDESISKRKHIDLASETEFQDRKKPHDIVAEQIELFNSIEIKDISIESDKEIEQLRAEFINDYSKYGGDLYIGDVAKAATKIEMLLTPNEWAKMWHWTSNENFDFDLADVSPSTIGEQYEQTMGNELKETNGYLYYDTSRAGQKSKGAFYTQEKITEYILDQTLGRKLNEIVNDLEKAAKNKKNVIIEKFLAMKIADITSGGGTFLAGAVKLFGNKYDAIVSAINDDKQLSKFPQLSSKTALQEHAIKFMIYGIDIDLKALIVSSFALGLETMIGESYKLPQLLGRTLLHSNSLVSTTGYASRKLFFDSYKDVIIELRKLRIALLEEKILISDYESERKHLQQNFINQVVLKHKTLDHKLLDNKLIESLEINITEVFFDAEGNMTDGFDIIFGNPPYISLQKMKKEKEIYHILGDFETFEARGDIYTLFYERSLQLLKPDGYLGFITSNKWMRAGYGGKLRDFFTAKHNPLLLVDLGSDMFNAQVDTNILIIQKSNNKKELKAIDLSKRAKDPKKRIENMSDFIKQNFTSINYQ
ncbi:Eco57I restriction-modification methylase domain-containing protein, partial [Carnobacterium maltaromaticum]|uniref:Eco57I restriction-modification methylase domain-containing protein n=1 Tax=Carnobacterium maltaromaticum TaxID=2751 RepID=UPI00191B9381